MMETTHRPVHRMSILLGLAFVWMSIGVPAYAQIGSGATLSAKDVRPDTLQTQYEGMSLHKNWLYHPGDRLEWADPEFDDSAWEIAADTRLFPHNLPASGWQGIGWFRLHLLVDSSLKNTSLALRLYHPGASEVYLDGKLIYRFGKVGASEAEEKPHWGLYPKVIHFETPGQHLIAVRYSGFSALAFAKLGFPMGFGMVLGDLNRSMKDRADLIKKSITYQMFFFGIPLAVAVVHLFLFIFDPRTRENLYFSLFATSFAAYVYFNFSGHFLTDSTLQPAIQKLGRTSQHILFLARMFRIWIILMCISGIRFLYAIFYDRLPRQFSVFLILGAGLGIWSWIEPLESWNAINLYALVLVGEMIRTVFVAVLNKKEGARIIGIGTLAMFCGAIYLLLRNLGLEGIPLLSNSFYLGFLGLIASISIHLSRNLAKSRLVFENQLHQVQALSQSNVELRQSRALEQVRATAAAMEQSRDIVNVVAALWKGLEESGLSFEAIGMGVLEPGTRQIQFYAAADTEGDVIGLLSDPTDRLFHADVVKGVNLWRNTVPLSQASALMKSQPGLHRGNRLYAYMDKMWDMDDPSQKLKNRPIIEARLHHGSLGLLASREGQLTENHCQIVEEFAEAISLGYARYFDLQKLEIQNRALEEANHQVQQANRAKSSFLANISHEIRTPINAILGYAQILQRSQDLLPAHRLAVETIQHSGDHLLTLINDVLDLSKIEADRLELNPHDFDLTHLLKTMESMFGIRCHQKDIGWALYWEQEDPLWVRGDEAKLKQILINLLDNAVKFTPKGEVSLHVTSDAEDRYSFQVMDTGPGISDPDHDRLFESFQQGSAGVNHGGTGLGLTISRRHVELMGGELSLQSKAGEGTTFSFTLPLPRGKKGQSEIAAWTHVKHLAPGYHVRALIAEDVAESRAILTHLLEDIGVEVTVVENGRQVLAQMEDALPDIVFLDIRMPVMDGQEAIQHIRKRPEWETVKTVAISASTFDFEREEVLSAGFDAFIGKPFRFEQVYASLAELLQVAYTYAEAETEVEDMSDVDWLDFELPDELIERLREATEFRRVTQMEACFQEIEQLGQEAGRLATHLRALRQQHNMGTILTILEGLHHGQ